ncbi:response regulator transcription factor [Pseudobacter ginsenosidimutans]|uniref:LuxR family two component transcriptional regulator n=1 Tax=Pseudobacter ginsenosidimutans TaxID=661488 RepID=A0A4Q7MUN9_9BACT|nr:response regulator transcription factor [Pseudobacter ginsenosidimutans]RZS70813.1 LuxR family two component transcriptional regulator [Pseudobacter ginsenosidimutans]
MPVKIAITDDHPMVISAMKSALELNPGRELIFTCTCGEALLQQLSIHQPDILLLDIRLPDLPGTSLCKQISAEYPFVRIIAITSHDDPWYIRQMLEMGAHGYLLKDTGFNILEEAISKVLNGNQYMDPRISLEPVNKTKELPFTRKEKEMLTLLSEMQSLQQIAIRMCIPLRMAEMHFYNLVQKLGTDDMNGLLQEARRRGLL